MKKQNKETLKKLASLALAGTTLFGVGAAAGCSNNVDLSGKLAIWLLDAGYGTDWADAMVEEYQKIYPDVEIAVVKDNMIASRFDATIRNPSTNDYDLIFSNSLNFNQYIGINLKVGGKVYEDLLLNMSEELYGKKAIGKDGVEENATVQSKIRDEFMTVVTNENGNAYAYPYAGGASGIIYNETLFEEKGWEVPETTGELIELTKKIYAEEVNVSGRAEADKIYPWAWSGKYPSYWTFLTYSLYGSYVGQDNFDAFWACKQYEGESGYPGTKSNGDLSAATAEVFRNEGRLEMLKVMEQILYPSVTDTTISSSKTNGSYDDGRYIDGYCIPNSQDMTVDKAQRMFLEGKAAMYVCGSWLEREMSDWYENHTDNTVKLKVMKTPVLDVAKTRWDKALADGAVTQKEYDAAMNFNVSAGADLVSVIPSYAEEKEQAVNFLRFMTSDYGAKIYAKHAKSILPLKYDWSNTAWTNDFNAFVNPGSFLQSQIELDKTCAYGYDGQRRCSIFLKNDFIAFYPNGQMPEPLLSRVNHSERKDAVTLYNQYYDVVSGAWKQQ